MKKNTGAVTRRCSVKKMFLKISQNSQENFPVNFVKFSKNTPGRLLLKIILIDCLQDIIICLIARRRQMKISKKSTQFVVSKSQVTQTYS